MWLVLCSPADRPALRAACGLRDRGLSPLAVVSIEALLLAPVWEHRIGRDGTASSFVRLHDGRTIDGGAVAGVLNRIAELPALTAGTGRDRDYIQQERVALLLSWLSSLRNVINDAAPQGLAGPWLAPAYAQWLAARAGLEVFPDRYRMVPHGAGPHAGLTRVSLVVLDGGVFGPPVPEPVRRACAAFARLADTRLVGVDLARSTAGWVFAAATPMPDLSIGGPALLDALAAAMRRP